MSRISALKRMILIGYRPLLPVAFVLLGLAGCENSDDETYTAEDYSSDSAQLAKLHSSDDENADAAEQDAVDAPGALLGIHRFAGWFKLEPVRVAKPGTLNQIIPEAAMCSAIETYRIRRAARCAYRNDGIRATVLFIETEGADDAYGLFSILSPRHGRDVRQDGSIRAVQSSREAKRVSGWRGSQYVEMLVTHNSPSSRDKSGKLIDALLDHILLTSPAAEPPLLWRAILREAPSHCMLLVVRRAGPLKLADDTRLREMDAAQIDTRLSLNGDVLLSVAAVPMGNGGLTNLIWLAEYPDAAIAAKVFADYQALHSADANTFMDAASGPYLFGTWSAAEESIQPVLPLLRSFLHTTTSQPGN